MNKFTFGMYKWKDIDTIIKVNPKYVLWAEQNVPYFSLTQEQHNAFGYLNSLFNSLKKTEREIKYGKRIF